MSDELSTADPSIKQEQSVEKEHLTLNQVRVDQVHNSMMASSSPARDFADDVENAKSRTPTMDELQKAAGAPGIVGSEPIPAKSLVIKTKKPRPYACPTCTRSFARLEHLKRHERSHTKEKPFQCPICERSFARRDLLLRHKQKLHASFSPGDEKSHVKSNTGAGGARPQQSQPGGASVGAAGGAGTAHAGGITGSVPVYRSSPQLIARQSAGRMRSIPSSHTPAASSSSSPSPLGVRLASNQQYPHDLHELEGLDLLTPLRSASPPNNTALPFPSYNSEQSVGIGGGAHPQSGFLQQIGFTPSTPDASVSAASSLQGTGNANAGHSQYQQGAQGVSPAVMNEWKQLNPLAHELEMLQSVAPPFRVLSSRASRASSFSAASATSYVRQKDIEAVAPTSAHFNQGPSEVGFATPQAYAFDDSPYDFEPLDLNFVSPAQLSQPPPRKRRVSVTANNNSGAAAGPAPGNDVHVKTTNNSTGSNMAAAPSISGNYNMDSSSPSGTAVQALRAQIRSQRQLYQHYGTDKTNSTGSLNSPSVNSLDSVDPGIPQYQNTPPHQMQPPAPQSQQQQYSSSPHQIPQHQLPQQHYSQIHNHPQIQQQQQQQPISLQSLDSSAQYLDGSYGELSLSPGMTPGYTPGMTPGFTPGFTPSMQPPVSYRTSMSPLPEEAGEIKDFLAQQNDDFVNSLFDADDDQPTASKKLNLSPSSVSNKDGNSTHIVSGLVNESNKLGGNNNSNNVGSASNTQRYIDSYYSGFDTHLSFVHKGSHISPYNISGLSSVAESPAMSPPSSSSSIGTGGGIDLASDAKLALTQAQAAVGAQTLGERGEAQAYYWAARDHNNSSALGGLEGLQADLLVAVLGLFFDEPSEHASSLERLAASITDSELIAASMGKSASAFDQAEAVSAGSVDFEWPMNAERLWEQFLVNQSRIRTLYALHAVCCWVRRPSERLLNVLESCECAPCEDDLWRAPTSDIWLRVLASKGLDARSVAENGGSRPHQFANVLATIRSGEVPAEEVSQFTLQSLLLALEQPRTTGDSPTTSSRAALRAWETLWARSPDASLDPSPLSGPIMSDCVGIVSLVAFSPLNMTSVLDALWKHDFAGVSREISETVRNQRHGLSNVANYAVDTLVWCEGHVTSYSIFFTTLLAVTECGLVLAESLRQINSKNTPLTPSEEQLIERSRKLISSVLKVVPSQDPNALPNGVLRAAVCLVRLSDWPLVGVLSRTLLAHAAA